MLAVLVALGGCATQGDFGEVKRSLSRDDMHDWLSSEAIAGTRSSPSAFPLTENERALRDLAYPLIEPPYDRQTFFSIAGEYGLTGRNRKAFDRTAYTAHLFGDTSRTAASRYAALQDDIENDTTRLPQFFETAARVLDIDGKRRKSMFYVSALSDSERADAIRRMDENAAIVAMVRRSLAQRASSYRYALERLVIVTPDPRAAAVEQSLNTLQAKIVSYSIHLPATWVREKSLASN